MGLSVKAACIHRVTCNMSAVNLHLFSPVASLALPQKTVDILNFLRLWKNCHNLESRGTFASNLCLTRCLRETIFQISSGRDGQASDR